MKEYSLYIFDLEGTLVDSSEERIYYSSTPNNMEYTSHIMPFKDTEPTLFRLSKMNKPMCIATKKRGDKSLSLLKEHGLDTYFDYIIGFEDVERQKPYPDCLLKCMSNYDFSKEEIVFIGDSPNDIYAAESAEIDGILIDREGYSSKLSYTYKITSLNDILEI